MSNSSLAATQSSPPEPSPLQRLIRTRDDLLPKEPEARGVVNRVRAAIISSKQQHADIERQIAESTAPLTAWARSGATGPEPELTPQAALALRDLRDKAAHLQIRVSELERSLPDHEEHSRATTAAILEAKEAIRQGALKIIEERAHQIADELQTAAETVSELELRLHGAMELLDRCSYDERPAPHLGINVVHSPALDALRGRRSKSARKMRQDLIEKRTIDRYSLEFSTQLDRLIAGEVDR